MSENAARPVGSESNYSKAPFTDNVKKSIPPMTPGSTGKRDGESVAAHGGSSKDNVFKEARRQYERTAADRSCNERSPW